MTLELEERLYHKFANFFELHYKKGALFQFDGEPSEIERTDDTVYYEGRVYTFKAGEHRAETEPNLPLLKRLITKQFALSLRENGYKSKGKYLFFKEEDIIDQPHSDIFNVFNGFRFRTIPLYGRLFLCIDPHLIILMETSIEYLLNQGVTGDQLSDFSVRYRNEEGKHVDGYLIETGRGDEFDSRLGSELLCKVRSYREFEDQIVSPRQVYPESRPELIQRILHSLNRSFSVITLQRQQSFLSSRTASKDRLKRTLEIIDELQELFPLQFGGFEVNLESKPIRIKW